MLMQEISFEDIENTKIFLFVLLQKEMNLRLYESILTNTFII